MAGKLTLKVSNAQAVVANLRQYGERARERANVVVQDSADRVFATSQSLCPVDTGFMKAHERKEFTPAGFGYRVGFDASDFPASFYPPFVIFGTRFQTAQDFLFAPFEAEKPRFRSELKEALSPRRGR